MRKTIIISYHSK